MHLAKTVFVVLAFALVACADGSTANRDGAGFADGVPFIDADPTPDAPDVPTADAEQSDAIPGCTINGFTAASATAPARMGQIALVWQKYIANSDTAEPFDRLTLELNYILNAPTTPHPYKYHETLTDPPVPIIQNYGTCTHCLFIEQDCASGTCSKFFLADYGLLEITENGGTGGVLVGSLTNVRFIEVIIDGFGDSVPVVGGDVWCLLSHEFDVLISVI